MKLRKIFKIFAGFTTGIIPTASTLVACETTERPPLSVTLLESFGEVTQSTHTSFVATHRTLKTDRYTTKRDNIVKLQDALKNLEPKFGGFPSYTILISKGRVDYDEILQEAKLTVEVGYEFDRAGEKSKLYTFRWSVKTSDKQVVDAFTLPSAVIIEPQAFFDFQEEFKKLNFSFTGNVGSPSHKAVNEDFTNLMRTFLARNESEVSVLFNPKKPELSPVIYTNRTETNPGAPRFYSTQVIGVTGDTDFLAPPKNQTGRPGSGTSGQPGYIAPQLSYLDSKMKMLESITRQGTMTVILSFEMRIKTATRSVSIRLMLRSQEYKFMSSLADTVKRREQNPVSTSLTGRSLVQGLVSVRNTISSPSYKPTVDDRNLEILLTKLSLVGFEVPLFERSEFADDFKTVRLKIWIKEIYFNKRTNPLNPSDTSSPFDTATASQIQTILKADGKLSFTVILATGEKLYPFTQEYTFDLNIIDTNEFVGVHTANAADLISTPINAFVTKGLIWRWAAQYFPGAYFGSPTMPKRSYLSITKEDYAILLSGIGSGTLEMSTFVSLLKKSNISPNITPLYPYLDLEAEVPAIIAPSIRITNSAVPNQVAVFDADLNLPGGPKLVQVATLNIQISYQSANSNWVVTNSDLDFVSKFYVEESHENVANRIHDYLSATFSSSNRESDILDADYNRLVDFNESYFKYYYDLLLNNTAAIKDEYENEIFPKVYSDISDLKPNTDYYAQAYMQYMQLLRAMFFPSMPLTNRVRLRLLSENLITSQVFQLSFEFGAIGATDGNARSVTYRIRKGPVTDDGLLTPGQSTVNARPMRIEDALIVKAIASDFKSFNTKNYEHITVMDRIFEVRNIASDGTMLLRLPRYSAIKAAPNLINNASNRILQFVWKNPGDILTVNFA